MQDRFKFRTYIPDRKFFKFWGLIKKGEYKGLCPTGEYSLDELLEKYTNQCTGLKDKNGKLVYEGDIIKIKRTSYHSAVQFDRNSMVARPDCYIYLRCEFVNSKFVLRNSFMRIDLDNLINYNEENNCLCLCGSYEKNGESYGWFYKDIFEFIQLSGNSYENPKLLESEVE